MATSTFDRKIEITNPESLRKLLEIMESDAPEMPVSNHPYNDAERKRGEDLLKQWLSHSRL